MKVKQQHAERHQGGAQPEKIDLAAVQVSSK